MFKRVSIRLFMVVTLILACTINSGGQPVAAQDSQGIIAVFMDNNGIAGFHWPLGTLMLVEVDDPDTLLNPDWSDSKEVISDGTGFYLGDFILEPGMLVTMSIPGYVKTHVITNLTFDGVDMVGDKLWGTADPGTRIGVIHQTNYDYQRWETADAEGNWLADFSVVGDETNELLLYDFAYGTVMMIIQNDEDGDHTQIDWHMPSPFISIQRTQNQIRSYDWPLGYPVTLTIDNPINGIGINYTEIAVPGDCNDWEPWTGCIYFNPGTAFQVLGGHLVTMSNGFLTLTMTVSIAQVTEINPEADTISGIAEPYASVEVRTTQDYRRHANADTTGNWIVDFSIPGEEEDEQDLLDLLPWDEGVLYAWQPNNCHTEVTWPYNVGMQVGGDVGAGNWYLGEEATLEIDNPVTPETPDFTASGYPSLGPWAYTGINFEVSDTYSLQVGDTVSVVQPSLSRECTVSPVKITRMDYLTDQISGISSPNAQVKVDAPLGSGDEWGRSRHTQADSAGYWMVDFSEPGTHWNYRPTEVEIVDIVTGMWINASEGDADGCFTGTSESIYLPRFRVELSGSLVNGLLFLPGTDVTLTIDDPATLQVPDFTQVQIVPEGSPDELTYPSVIFDYVGFMVQEGFLVTLTDGEVTKTHIVTGLEISVVDEVEDQVFGLAAPSSTVRVVAYDEQAYVNRYLTTAIDGTWMADFALPGPLPGEETVIDLDPETTIYAYQIDEDYDRTFLYWVPSNQPPEITSLTAPLEPLALGTPVFASATFTDPDAGQTHTGTWDWGDGTTSTGTVDEAAGAVSGSHTYTAPGVYTLGLSLCDEALECTYKIYQYIVVYDPSAGFLTGRGWYQSPAGAYTWDETASGPAYFGFVSKYKKGGTAPDGKTQLSFEAGRLSFQATSFQWLVIVGSKAQLRGSGIVNGSGSYAFLMTVIDGDLMGGDWADTFRIQIWDPATGVIIYDNEMGRPYLADSITAVEGGQIVIHR